MRVLPLRKLLIWNTQRVLGCVFGRQWHGLRLECSFAVERISRRVGNMNNIFRKLWRNEEAQDIAEYAVMLAVILVIVVGTIRLIGANANNVFSSVASSIAQ